MAIAASLTLAAAAPFRISRGISSQIRFQIACAAAGCIIAAVALYVFSVNAILLDGTAIRRAERRLLAIEREVFQLRERTVRQRSPAWLTERSDAYGMIAIGDVRFLTRDEAVALSR